MDHQPVAEAQHTGIVEAASKAASSIMH